MAGEGKTIPKGFVHDPDKEEKEKTFIQELSEYIASVIERAKEYCMPPFTYGEDGKKIYPHDYEEANNIDLQKFLWFFKAVNYDRSICEAMLHPKALLLRNELLDTKLTDLMISAKMKELYVLSAIGLKEPNVTN